MQIKEYMHNLIIGSKVISYTIRKSLRAKYVRILISADGVQVVAPVFIDDKEIILLVEKKREWIYKKVLNFHQRYTPMKPQGKFTTGEKLLLMGEYYQINILENVGGKSCIKFLNDQFFVSINQEIPPEKRAEVIRSKLEQWYIDYAKKFIAERLELFKVKIGVKITTVRYKNQKTRWGSCSSKGNLNFNWRLIMAPKTILDYVVVHELCHLKHMDHSRKFWELVSSFIPDYKERRKWLKENGHNLNF